MNSAAIQNMNVAYLNRQEFARTTDLAIDVKKAVLRAELSEPIRAVHVFVHQLPQALVAIINNTDETAARVVIAQIFVAALQRVIAEDFDTQLNLPSKQRELEVIEKKLTKLEIDSNSSSQTMVDNLINMYSKAI